MEWIPIKDPRKLEDGKWYVVWLGGGPDFLVWFEGRWIWPVRASFLEIENVTHWLDIKPPEDT